MYSKKSDYKYFKEISCDNVSIRELKDGDESDLFELFGNENVIKYLGFEQYKDISDAKNLIDRAKIQYENKQIFYLGIISNKNNKLIGYIGLSRYDLTEFTCQVVYGLNQTYWAKGLMVEALKLFIQYLFNMQNKKLIIATHIDVNENSGKVMIKAGMLRDHTYDQLMVIKGKTEKLIGYSIKKE